MGNSQSYYQNTWVETSFLKRVFVALNTTFNSSLEGRQRNIIRFIIYYLNWLESPHLNIQDLRLQYRLHRGDNNGTVPVLGQINRDCDAIRNRLKVLCHPDYFGGMNATMALLKAVEDSFAEGFMPPKFRGGKRGKDSATAVTVQDFDLFMAADGGLEKPMEIFRQGRDRTMEAPGDDSHRALPHYCDRGVPNPQALSKPEGPGSSPPDGPLQREKIENAVIRGLSNDPDDAADIQTVFSSIDLTVFLRSPQFDLDWVIKEKLLELDYKIDVAMEKKRALIEARDNLKERWYGKCSK